MSPSDPAGKSDSPASPESLSAGEDYNPKIPDVPAAFRAVSKQGERHRYSGEPWVANMVESHVQGIAPYGDYFLLTHNNKGYSRGLMLVINRSEQKLVQKFDTPREHFNHPGGCQRIGSRVAVALENSDASESYIVFYNLAKMTNSVEPTELAYKIHRGSQGAGGVGITNFTNPWGEERYALVVYDNGSLDLYLSNGSVLGQADFAFNRIAAGLKPEGSGYSEVCLVTGTDQSLYMIGFATKDPETSAEDHADLFSVTLDSPKVRKLDSRHMYTEHGGVTGMDGVHFRWAAGLKVREDLSLEFFATQRNFVGNEFYANTFRQPGS